LTYFGYSFSSYTAKQKEVAEIFENRSLWAEKAIINVANMGMFSSDRSIMDYADKIWNVSYTKY
jgi:starch phosphorylase